MSWAAKQYQMGLKSKTDQRATESAAKKKGLWGSLGGTLGSLAGMALLANPIGAVVGSTALAAGLGTGIGAFVGGHVGAEGLTSTKNKNILAGKHKGTTFHKKDAKKIGKDLKGDIATGAIKSGVSAGFMDKMDIGNLIKDLNPGVDPSTFDWIKDV